MRARSEQNFALRRHLDRNHLHRALPGPFLRERLASREPDIERRVPCTSAEGLHDLGGLLADLVTGVRAVHGPTIVIYLTGWTRGKSRVRLN